MKISLWICLCSLLLIITGCAGNEEKGDPSVLITTDLEFSKMSVEEGLNTAFIAYADDSVVKVRNGAFPIIGKDSMTRIYLSRPDTGVILKWYPLKADISRSGDLGYTFGNWELTMKSLDTTLYGNYLTIWKKQPDGTWRYVLDAGSDTPKPE